MNRWGEINTEDMDWNSPALMKTGENLDLFPSMMELWEKPSDALEISCYDFNPGKLPNFYLAKDWIYLHLFTFISMSVCILDF